MKLRHALLASAALALSGASFVGPASAADTYVPPPVFIPPAPPPVVVAEAYDWTGFYVGAHGGYAFGPAESLPFGVLTGVGDSDLDGPFYGLQAGVLFGSNIIFGIEADYSWTGIEGAYAGPPGPAAVLQEIDSIATVRGKLGFPMGSNGQVLPYITGGWGWLDATRTSDGQVATNGHDGWNVGLGVDIGVSENVSVGVLYLFQDYSEEVYDFAVGNDPLIDIDLHSISFRVDWHL